MHVVCCSPRETFSTLASSQGQLDLGCPPRTTLALARLDDAALPTVPVSRTDPAHARPAPLGAQLPPLLVLIALARRAALSRTRRAHRARGGINLREASDWWILQAQEGGQSLRIDLLCAPDLERRVGAFLRARLSRWTMWADGLHTRTACVHRLQATRPTSPDRDPQDPRRNHRSSASPSLVLLRALMNARETNSTSNANSPSSFPNLTRSSGPWPARSSCVGTGRGRLRSSCGARGSRLAERKGR